MAVRRNLHVRRRPVERDFEQRAVAAGTARARVNQRGQRASGRRSEKPSTLPWNTVCGVSFALIFHDAESRRGAVGDTPEIDELAHVLVGAKRLRSLRSPRHVGGEAALDCWVGGVDEERAALAAVRADYENSVPFG